METIQTKPGVTIGFLRPPAMPDETETNYRKCLYVNNTMLHVYYIGKLSEITEDQAKELVDLGKIEIDYKGEKRHADLDEVYAMDKFMGKNPGERYKLQLKVVAESVGIKEKDFDQYLVIKL